MSLAHANADSVKPSRLQASCVAIGGHGVLMLGDSGAGKSDLCLRLIDRGAVLVADDQVELKRDGEQILASCPEKIAEHIEVRGVGIFNVKSATNVPVWLAVHLTKPEWIERLPLPEPYQVAGLNIPQILIWGFESSAAIKIEMALMALKDGSMLVGAFKE